MLSGLMKLFPYIISLGFIINSCSTTKTYSSKELSISKNIAHQIVIHGEKNFFEEKNFYKYYYAGDLNGKALEMIVIDNYPFINNNPENLGKEDELKITLRDLTTMMPLFFLQDKGIDGLEFEDLFISYDSITTRIFPSEKYSKSFQDELYEDFIRMTNNGIEAMQSGNMTKISSSYAHYKDIRDIAYEILDNPKGDFYVKGESRIYAIAFRIENHGYVEFNVYDNPPLIFESKADFGEEDSLVVFYLNLDDNTSKKFVDKGINGPGNGDYQKTHSLNIENPNNKLIEYGKQNKEFYKEYSNMIIFSKMILNYAR